MATGQGKVAHRACGHKNQLHQNFLFEVSIKLIFHACFNGEIFVLIGSHLGPHFAFQSQKQLVSHMLFQQQRTLISK